jgi:hypothetical protein
VKIQRGNEEQSGTKEARESERKINKYREKRVKEWEREREIEGKINK